MGRDLLITRPAPLRALSAQRNARLAGLVSMACLVGTIGLGCQREAGVASGKGAAATDAAQVTQRASPVTPSAPKRGSCHRVGPLACEEAPAASGPEFLKQLHSCLFGYREMEYGRIAQVTGAEQLDRGAGIAGTGVAEVAAFAVTARYGADAEPRTARSVYLAAEYGDRLCLVDQLMFPRAPALPCREQFHFRWQPAQHGSSAPPGLIVETETACSYAQGTGIRCASAEYRVSDGKFWIVRETDREGACSS